ncbi:MULTISPECIES: transposase [Azospirillum]|uniref:Transposase n=1 Tax=Azospirillum lipoferum TaxID=193 RepID=A0A5A9GQD0_AZOLI|nr:transposase [Azospirillum lipoferum]
MRRHELSDAQWALVSELMTSDGGPGGRWRNHRDVVNGLFWKLNTGVPWRDIPTCYGPWQTACWLTNRRNRPRTDTLRQWQNLKPSPSCQRTGASRY